MIIFVNELKKEVKKDITLFDVKDVFMPSADIVIYNGFPEKKDIVIKEFDHIFLIKRGVIPNEDEFEKTLISRHTPGVHEKVSKATVGIAGLGGLGSNVATMLARLGIKKLLLVDFDIVEPSNLNRQQYFISHLGMNKTDAMKDLISEINPYVEVEILNKFIDKTNVKSIFKNVDIIVEAFDSADSKAMIINTILHELPNHYIVAASGLAGYFSNNSIRTKRISDKFYLIGDDISEAKSGCGLMAPRANLAAAHQANTVLRIIMGELEVD